MYRIKFVNLQSGDKHIIHETETRQKQYDSLILAAEEVEHHHRVYSAPGKPPYDHQVIDERGQVVYDPKKR